MNPFYMQVVHCDTPAGRLGLMTCYDLRFPWLSDVLRGQGGAEILTYPSAFTVKTGVYVNMWQGNFPRSTSGQISVTDLVYLAVVQARHTGRCCCGHVQSRHRFVMSVVHMRSLKCWHRHVRRDSMATSSVCRAVLRHCSSTGRAAQQVRAGHYLPWLHNHISQSHTANLAAYAICSKRQSYGHALIIDPWGTIVGKLDDPLATGIAVADIDMRQVQDLRLKMPIWDHRTNARQLCGERDQCCT